MTFEIDEKADAIIELDFLKRTRSWKTEVEEGSDKYGWFGAALDYS
jgi:hypothetical protein